MRPTQHPIILVVVMTLLVAGLAAAWLGFRKAEVERYYHQTFVMEDSSMEPTIAKDTELESDTRYETLQRGDVVVVSSPVDRQSLARRVIGLPGETIEFSNDQMTIMNNENPSGFVLEETYTQDTLARTRFSWTLKEDEYFVLSDNRSDGNDSSKFGPVPRSSILAKIIGPY